MFLDNLKNELSGILSGSTLIVGIGNQMRSDDAFGPALISRIVGRIKASCLDVGSSPENYIGKIVKMCPGVILFVDTVSMNEPVATIKLISEKEIPVYGFSTHNMSPKLMIENIKSQINTKIFMLGIQPKNLEFGEEISKEINEALLRLESILIDILKNR